VDDDPDIRDILKLTLEEEEYEILEAKDGEEALRIIKTKPLHLVLLDSKIPKVEGPQVLRTVKKDILLRHLPVIMVTGKGEVHDKVDGIDAGADDYVVKPFEPKELLARIKMVLRRSERDLDANPLTRLPGNVSILTEITRRMEEKQIFSVCYIDLNKFKAYNDTYGFEHGDEVIRETARILIRTAQECGNPDDFVGHIGGDDYVVITTPEKTDELCRKIIAYFDGTSPSFYNEADRTKGYIVAHNRQGQEQKVPLISISIGVVSNETREISHVGEIGEIGAELKALAKAQEKSTVIKDKRAG
ncbi:MAG: response regulator, partial [Candidatus Omnitrophica bacterium]|nr:response regulator [Candidatus Omnitrophota bacterium]